MTSPTRQDSASARRSLERQLALTTLIARLATDFIGLEFDEIDGGIQRALREVSEFFGNDHAGIATSNSDGSAWTLEHEWHQDGGPPIASDFGPILTASQDVHEQLQRGVATIVPDLTNVWSLASNDQNAMIASLGLQSIALLPIVPTPGELKGLVIFAGSKPVSDSETDLRTVADVVAGFFLHALERKASDRALATSQGRMRVLEESDGIGMFLADADDKITTISRRLLDHCPNVLNDALRWQELLQPMDGSSIHEIESSLSAPGGCHAFEAGFGSGESSKTYMVSLTRIDDADDADDVETVGLLIDLSERKKAEAQLAFHDELNRLTTRLAGRFLTAKASNSEKVMREAMGEIGEFFEVDRCSFYLADAEYKEALATYFWTKSDVDEAAEPVQVIPREWFPKFYDWIFVQRQIAIIEFDELAESFKKLSRQLLTANFRNALILPIVVGDRVIGFLAASDSQDPRKWEHSRVAALNVLGEILGSAYDRHQTREQLAEINTNLGKLVEERTVQLRTANAELEAFSYSVSHDLRSPLRTIDGFSELLLQEHSGQLGDNGRAFLSRVRTSSQQMGSLIDALLELARTSRAPGTQQTIDLTVIAEFVAAQLQESSRVKFEIATDLKLIGDQRLIGLLITRLFSNAVKTAPRGSTIEFGAEGGAYFVRHPAPDLKPKTATISSEHDRPGNQTDQLDNGSAGLVTIRHIVDLHGGRIWDTSSNVKTKTICFTLSPTSPDKSLVRAT